MEPMMNTEMNPAFKAPKTALLSVAAVGVLALSACGPDDALDTEGSGEPDSPVTVGTENGATQEEASGEDTESENSETDDTEEAGPDEEEEVSDADRPDEPLYDAVDAVLAEYPDGVITELDTDDSYYEIYVYDGETEWELEVDRESFEIIDTEDDGIDSDDQEKAEAVEIDFVEALVAAADEGGAMADEAELDTEDGTVVWEIALTNDVEVYVDVASGEVVKVDS